jgi:hypothetical protein
MWHIWEAGKVHTGLWWGILKERDHLEHIRIGERIIFKSIFKMWDVEWGGMDWSDVA